MCNTTEALHRLKTYLVERGYCEPSADAMATVDMAIALVDMRFQSRRYPRRSARVAREQRRQRQVRLLTAFREADIRQKEIAAQLQISCALVSNWARQRQVITTRDERMLRQLAQQLAIEVPA